MTPIKAAAEPSREALKPCPICQSRLVTLFERQEGLFIVSCENDDCIFGVETHGHSANEAVLRWNTRSAPAGNAGATPEYVLSQLHAAIDDIDISAYNAAKYRISLVIAALPQPPEAFADEIKRADTGPPEASFDNASDMLGYLNAPREAGEIAITDAMAEAGARIAAKQRGHRNCDEEIITDAGKQPVWRFYVEEARAILALFASPSPIPEAPGAREEIARIIDPGAHFRDIEGVIWAKCDIQRRELAYQKADAILRALRGVRAMTDQRSYPDNAELANRMEELRSLSAENWRVEKEPHSYDDGTTHFNHVRYTAKHFGEDMTVEVASHVSANLGELLCLLNNNLDQIIGALRSGGVAQAPIGYAAYSPVYGWRVDLAATNEKIATAVLMRSISSAAQQGWEIRPIYALSSLTSTTRVCPDCGMREACGDECPNAPLSSTEGRTP